MPASVPYRRSGDGRHIRLMLVDDSIVARSVFRTMLEPFPDFSVVATASTADQALAQLDQTAVDIVLLDLAMPGMDGLTALPEIIRRGQGAQVLVVSASAGAGADACVRALTLGAADTMEKPSAGGFGEAFRTELITKLRRIGAERSGSDRAHRDDRAAPRISSVLSPTVEGPIDCLAIGASTGGLHALSALFGRLGAACDMPILITQHLPASFMPYFAAQITEIARRPARVARTGDVLEPGTILVAPGDGHLTLARAGHRARVELSHELAVSGCLPSVDPMFASVAELYAERAFAVVLSGMGRDGALGARAIVAAGGEIAVQDRMTSVVWGMPGSVAAGGLAAIIAPPAGIAARIEQRLGRSPWR